MTWQIITGDCVEAMAGMPACSVDAVVCDPPYLLTFMGRSWDHAPTPVEGQAMHKRWAREALRVLKPGGHLLAFGGTRTYHRLACAVEDAGFEIRDTIAWMYGSGFPKSLDVGKAIDKRADWKLTAELAAEVRRAREATGMTLAQVGQAMLGATDGQYGTLYARGGFKFFETGSQAPSRPEWDALCRVLPIEPRFMAVYEAAERERIGTNANIERARRSGGLIAFGKGSLDDAITAPATPEAEQWDGWGTALKPAHEPIVVARKPLSGTVAQTILTYGTGGLNIDATRITSDSSEGLGGETGARGCRVHGVCGLRSIDETASLTSEESAAPDDLWSEVHGGGASGCRQPSLDRGGVDREANGLPHDADVELERGRQGASTDADASRDPRASACDGAGVGASVADERARPSHQRDQGGQPAGESERDGLGDPLARAPSRAASAGFARDGEQDPTGCTCGSTVGRWPANVVLAHTDECVPVGTRKVKGHKGYPNGPGGNDQGAAWSSEEVSSTLHKRTEPWSGHPDIETTAWSCHPGCPVRLLDEQTGELGNCGGPKSTTHDAGMFGIGQPGRIFSDSGGASRFFYCAKSSSGERNAGLDGFEEGVPTERFNASALRYEAGCDPTPRAQQRIARNTHPTVKPIDLMRWLVRLVTPPGGTILDPFTGSGTTGCAAVLEHFDFIGIERDPDYIEIAKARIAWWAEHPEGMKLVKRLEADLERKGKADAGQLVLDVNTTRKEAA